MLSRIAASCVFAMLAYAAVQAQESRQPTSPEGPPPPGQEGPPPSTQGPTPAPERPPPRVEDAPPRQQSPQPRAEIRPSDRCGAVAYTADGAFGAAFGIDTCEDAERLAVDECRRESTDKADCSRGVVRRTEAWFYIQFCRSGNTWGAHVSTGRTIAEANQAAAQYAQKSPYGPGNCRLVPNGLFHSGGLHTKM